MSSYEKLRQLLELSSRKDVFNVLLKSKVEDYQSLSKDQWIFIISIIESSLRENSSDDKEDFALQSWLQDCLKFFTMMKSTILQAGMEISFLISNLLLESVSVSMKISQSQNEEKRESNTSQPLVKLALSIFAGGEIPITEELSKTIYNLLDRVIGKLCDFTEGKLNNLDISTTVEIWKTVFNTLITYGRRSQNDAGKKNLQLIATRPISSLLKEVCRSIELVCKVEAQKQPIEQIDKYLRVTNFYLRLLCLIVAAMKHRDFPAAKDFFSCYKMAKILPKHLKGTQIVQLLDKYVQNHLDELFKCVFKHPDIIGFISDFLTQNKVKRACAIILAFLDATNEDGDSYYIFENIEKFMKIFEECCKDPFLHTQPHYYGQLIVHFTALTLLCSTNEMIQYFKRNVLNEHFWIGSASTEILITLQCYQHTHFPESNENLVQELQFWQRCFDSFAWFSNDVRRYHVERLLKNCLKLCYGKTALAQTSINGPSKFVIAMTLKETQNSDSHCDHAVQKLNSLLDRFSAGECKKDDYYEMVSSIKLINSLSCPPEILKPLSTVLIVLLSGDPTFSDSFHLFIKVTLNLITKFISSTKADTLKEILNCLYKNNCRKFYPEAFKFLKACSSSNSEDLRTLSKAILKRHYSEVFADKLVKVEPDLIEKLNLNCKDYCSSCKETVNSIEPLFKKKCTESKWQ